MRQSLPWLLIALLLMPSAAQADTLEEGARLTLVAEGLDMPVDLAIAPDGALYYAELQGGLRRIAPGASTPDPEPLWTPPNLQTGGERGFVGLALDPMFEESRAFYVFYVVNESGTIHNRLSKVVDGEETVLLDGLYSEIMHNSGRILFLPDGTLLVSTGDAVIDTAGPHNAMHAHDETNLSGKVLRLNPDGSAAADNPWGNEVWTKGHRNVYGLAVSPDGVVIGTENGPHTGDEVNLLEAGNDYGWPTCAGSCGKPEFVDPILEYESTIAPTGATWYHGHFYFSDFNAGRVHRIHPQENGTWADDRVLRLDQPRILDVEAGHDGLYFSTWSEVFRLEVDEAWHQGEGTQLRPPIDVGTPGGQGGDEEDPNGAGEISESTRGMPAPGVAWLLLVAILLARRMR